MQEVSCNTDVNTADYVAPFFRFSWASFTANLNQLETCDNLVSEKLTHPKHVDAFRASTEVLVAVLQNMQEHLYLCFWIRKHRNVNLFVAMSRLAL